MKVEVLCGGNIKHALKEIGIEYSIVFNNGTYKIVEIEKRDLKTLEESPMELWRDAWYRYTKGSNLGTPFDCFTINGQMIIAWAGKKRENLMDTWYDMDFDEKSKYEHSFKNYEKNIMPYEYDSVTNYLSNELGVSDDTGVCAVLTDMAKHNGKTIKWLLENLEPNKK